MKKIITLLTVFISIFGYSQTTTLPSMQDRLSQDMLDKMNPNAITSQRDAFVDINQIENVQSQSFQSEVLVKNENYNLRLDRETYLSFSGTYLSGKTESTYDSNGNRTLEILYSWYTDSQPFAPWLKYENTYEENGNKTLEIRYRWNADSQSFVPDYKYENTYDENGNRNVNIGYNWNTDSQSFVTSAKWEFTYDANGNQTLGRIYTWNTDSQSFVGYSKREKAYDANGNQTLQIDHQWNTDSQSFVPRYKYEWAYDANGNQTLYIHYYWNTDSQSLVADYKNEYTYDANNLRTNLTIYDWYATLGVYKPSFKTDTSTQSETETNLVREGITYEYDTNFNTWSELEGEEFKSY